MNAEEQKAKEDFSKCAQESSEPVGGESCGTNVQRLDLPLHGVDDGKTIDAYLTSRIGGYRGSDGCPNFGRSVLGCIEKEKTF